MTCIVGFTDKKNNVTWMGGDSLGSNGYSQDLNLAGKVFHNDILTNVVIGGTSTFRHLDLLKYSKNLFPEVDKYKLEKKEITIDHKYMVTSFIPNVLFFKQELFLKPIKIEEGIFLLESMEIFFKYSLIILFLRLQNAMMLLVVELYLLKVVYMLLLKTIPILLQNSIFFVLSKLLKKQCAELNVLLLLSTVMEKVKQL